MPCEAPPMGIGTRPTQAWAKQSFCMGLHGGCMGLHGAAKLLPFSLGSQGQAEPLRTILTSACTKKKTARQSAFSRLLCCIPILVASQVSTSKAHPILGTPHPTLHTSPTNIPPQLTVICTNPHRKHCSLPASVAQVSLPHTS